MLLHLKNSMAGCVSLLSCSITKPLQHAAVLQSTSSLVSFLVLQVTVFSTSEKKRAEALKTLKADHFVVSKDEEQMKVSRLVC